MRIPLSIISIVLLSLVGCKQEAGYDPWQGKPGPKVLVTFAPLHCFAVNVAGPDATVVSMLTSHGPHGFDPTDAEGRLVAKADIFFMNGLELDNSIVEKLRKSRRDSLKVVELGDAIDTATLQQMDHDHDHGHAHDHAGHDHHHHGQYDPHVWLGIPQAKVMVQRIADELAALDPAHKDGYQQRATAYIAKLDALHAEGKAMLKDKKERSFVTFHESLAYFAQSYDLKIAGVIQVDPGVEPSRTQMNKVIETCKNEKVRLIAVEPQFPTNTAARSVMESLRAIPGFADAAFVEVDPLETAERAELGPNYYETKIRENLANLAKVLK